MSMLLLDLFNILCVDIYILLVYAYIIKFN